MTRVWLNGALVREGDAALSITDRGFTLADGVFETVRTAGSHPIWLEEHLDRLEKGASLLGIPLFYSRADISAGVAELLECEGRGRGALRITLSRGPTLKRGLWNPGDAARSTLLMTVAEHRPAPLSELAVSRATRRNDRSPLSRIKSLNYGDNILARREALELGAKDAIMLNTRDHLACATVGNLFVRIGDVWLTPPEGDGALPGLARSRMIGRLEARERSIHISELKRISAAIVTNSLGSYSVEKLEERALEVDMSPEELECIYTD